MSLVGKTAQEAAEATGQKIRSEIKADLLELKSEINRDVRVTVSDEMQKYFGDMSPTEHAISHHKAEKWFSIFDNVTSSAWTKALGFLFQWSVIGLILWGLTTTVVPAIIKEELKQNKPTPANTSKVD